VKIQAFLQGHADADTDRRSDVSFISLYPHMLPGRGKGEGLSPGSTGMMVDILNGMIPDSLGLERLLFTGFRGAHPRRSEPGEQAAAIDETDFWSRSQESAWSSFCPGS